LRILGSAAIVLIGFGGGAWKINAIRVDPGVALLLPEHGAQWIRMQKNDGLKLHWDEDFTAAYRTHFTVERVPEKAILYVRPFRHVAVYLDGVLIDQTSGDFTQWKRRYKFDLARYPQLTPGTHELFLSVVNRTGPPAVLAYCDALNIYTDSHWETKDGESDRWRPAALADAPVSNPIGEQLPRADKVFFKQWPVFAPLFLMVFCWTLAMERREGPPKWLRRITPSASGIRWALLIAWTVLAANNITKLPYAFGFDVPQHMEYIEFLLRKGRVPFATEGWQMFQSPFYYLLSAPLYVLFSELLSVAKMPDALRIVPLLCGAVQVECCYRAVRRVYPDRQYLQSLGTVLGGLLPINVYQSQYMGNEPLAAVLCSVVVVMALTILRDPTASWSYRRFVLIGILIGLGLLTKVSDVLICGPLILLIVYAGYLRDATPGARYRGMFGALVVIFGVAFLVCGWYYVRNWVELGSPFVGGWDKARGYIWWQEPGYRTVSQFVHFGQSLLYPFYSSVHGLWDGLYSTLWLDGYDGGADILVEPYWNMSFLLACLWLSLLPTAALVVGAVATLAKPAKSAREGQLFALVCLITYFLAIVMMMLQVPSYSTLKATYALGALCCFAIVAAQGFDWLTRNRIGRGVVYGGMACWVFAVYAGYFVV
jgi:hypothetical protein